MYLLQALYVTNGMRVQYNNSSRVVIIVVSAVDDKESKIERKDENRDVVVILLLCMIVTVASPTSHILAFHLDNEKEKHTKHVETCKQH